MKSFLVVLLCMLGLAAAGAFQANGQDISEDTVYVDRGVLAYSEKRFDDALKELGEALRLNANSYQALYYQGLIYQELNRPADARLALERAYELRPQSPDIAFQLGVLYVKQQEYDKAEPLLRQVYRADPDRPNLGFYLGLVDYRKKNYRSALEFFRAAHPSDEEFAQLARFYAGLAAGASGFPRIAQGELNEAMRIRPGSPVSNLIPRFSDLLGEEAQKEKFFHGELRFGVVYDTAASLVLGPALQVFPVDPYSENIPPPSGVNVLPPVKQKSVGELAGVDLSYTWLKTLDWEATVAYRFLYVEENQAAAFSSLNHIPSFNIVKKGVMSDLPYFAGLLWSYENIALGHDNALQRWTANPYFTLVEGAHNVTNVQYRLQVKDFYRGPFVHAELRNALNYMVGPTHYFLFDNGRHFIKLGYQYDRENAIGANWSYNGNRLLIGFQYTLPWQDIRLQCDLDYQWRGYLNKHTLLPEDQPRTIKREDREGLYFVSLSKDFTVGSQKFNAALEYVFDNAYSNFSAYSFTRHVVIPSIAWRF